MVIDELLMKVRQEEFLREAARYRLISQAEKRGSVRRKYSYGKALVGLGSSLCKWGNLLQDRFGDSRMVTSCQSTNSCIKA
jgi:hypothetical protein